MNLTKSIKESRTPFFIGSQPSSVNPRTLVRLDTETSNKLLMTTISHHSIKQGKKTPWKRLAVLNYIMLAVLGAIFMLCPSSGSGQTPDKAFIEVNVTGVGLDPATAEKQAVVSAVEQAVGSYLDHEALVKNEKLIYDKILSASNGFVKDYKVTEPAHKSCNNSFSFDLRVQRANC